MYFSKLKDFFVSLFYLAFIKPTNVSDHFAGPCTCFFVNHIHMLTLFYKFVTFSIIMLLFDHGIFCLFAIFILHSRESDILLCFGPRVRTRLGVANLLLSLTPICYFLKYFAGNPGAVLLSKILGSVVSITDIFFDVIISYF